MAQPSRSGWVAISTWPPPPDKDEDEQATNPGTAGVSKRKPDAGIDPSAGRSAAPAGPPKRRCAPRPIAVQPAEACLASWARRQPAVLAEATKTCGSTASPRTRLHVLARSRAGQTFLRGEVAKVSCRAKRITASRLVPVYMPGSCAHKRSRTLPSLVLCRVPWERTAVCSARGYRGGCRHVDHHGVVRVLAAHYD